MDDPEFERLFRVYGTDPIVARYVLSNSLMQRISDLKKKLKREIFLSFRNNRLYVAIPHGNQFEIDVFKSFYDTDRIVEFYNDLRISYDIVEDLNMNTRIWANNGENKISILEPSVNNNPKRKKVYNILSLTLGFLGLHYFYIGYYLKGLTYIAITALPTFLIIYNTFIVKDNHKGEFVPLYIFFMIAWFIFGNLYSGTIKNDSRGVPMT